MSGRSKIKIGSEDFRVNPGLEFKLSDRPTDIKPICRSKKQYKKLLDEHVEALECGRSSTFTTRPIAMHFCWSSKGWTQRARTVAPTATSCPGLNRRAARSPNRSSRAPKSCKHDFLLANQPTPARARTHRHLQPLLLRGGFRRPRASRDPAPDYPREELREDNNFLETALPLHRRISKTTSIETGHES